MRKKNKIVNELHISAAGGKGLGMGKSVDGKVIMVKGAIPGDVVDVVLTKRQKKYDQANILSFHKESEHRIKPRCVHFGVCGGCKWQNMAYEHQLYCKQNEVESNLNRIARVDSFEVEKIIGAEEVFFYRNKMEFSFSNARWILPEEMVGEEVIENKNALGFHIPGMWSKVLDLQECHLQSEFSEEIRLALKKFSNENNLEFFDLRNQSGLLRTLMIRNSTLGETMVLIQFFQNHKENIIKVMDFLKDTFPKITSLLYTINPKANDTLYDRDIVTHYGKDFINEMLGGFTFKIGPKSFFQTNSKQAEKLYQKVLEYANLSGEELIYDLYCGTGTIGIFLSKYAKGIVGVESVEEAVEAAKENAKENGVENAHFYCGDMRYVFTSEFIKEKKLPDVIVTDPPRDGMHPNVVEAINQSGVERLVYVSCNSATQARDIALMKDHYRLVKICPVDLFPHTHHVENVALLEKIN